jgi:hypothetical protein
MAYALQCSPTMRASIRPVFVSCVSLLWGLTVVGCADADSQGEPPTPVGGKADGFGDHSLLIRAEQFAFELPSMGMPPSAGAPWPGRTFHVFVQSLDTSEYLYKAAVVDTMGGFELEFEQALVDGEAYRVLAYTEEQPFATVFGCQEGDPLGVWEFDPVHGPQEIIMTPDLPRSPDPGQDVELCNALAGDPSPRFDLTLTGDGFFEQNQLEVLKLSILPQAEDPIPSANLGYFGWTGPAIGAIEGPGSIRHTSTEALAEGRRERILLYLEADGNRECSEGDYVGIVTTDPVSSDLELVFSPTDFPGSGDPAADLAECRNLHRSLAAPTGEYALTFKGAGFDAFEGSTLRLGSFVDVDQPSQRLAEAPIEGGAFTITISEVVPKLGAVNNLLLFDADGDGRCASDQDGIIIHPAGYAGRDQEFSLGPDNVFYDSGALGAFITNEELCDRVFGTAP